MNSGLHTLARRVGLGRAAYLFWHRPRAALARSRREGGPIEQWRTARGRSEMRAAVDRLQPITAPLRPAPEITFLTGRRFWYQTAFCLYTLQWHAQQNFRVTVHDDGSLDDAGAARLRELFPHLRVVRRSENDARIAALLPETKFPRLHAERRQAYPNFLKLTDVHAGMQGWRLVLDSDMLFFRRPDLLLRWLDQPAQPIHLVDVDSAYHYPIAEMSCVAGAAVTPRVNVGFCGLNSSEIDWEKLEHWARLLIEKHATHYYLEQALSAMLLAGRPCVAAPTEDYLVMPTDAECRLPSAVLHHYVDLSKRGYFRYAWRNVPLK